MIFLFFRHYQQTARVKAFSAYIYTYNIQNEHRDKQKQQEGLNAMRTTQEKIYFFERCIHEIVSEIERRSFRFDDYPPLIELVIEIQNQIQRLKRIKKYHEKH